ncbi:MAG: acyltransferase [Chthoniobacterales bacterium]|nr:acyltransferase [Chthoniobacterales bacterium]
MSGNYSYARRIWFDGVLYVCNHLIAHFPSHFLRKVFYRSVMQFEIGAGSFIFMGAKFDARRGFSLGSHSVINDRCRLDNRGGLEIGSNVSISSEVCILTADHDPRSSSFAGRNRAVRIDDRVFVGTRATILPGVTVGKGAFVAAGALVTKNVAPFAIVAGSPARVIGTRPTDLSYQIHYDRLFA